MKFLHFIYVCLGTHVIRSPEAVQLSCCSWTARSDLDLTVLGREASAGSPGGRCRLSQGTAGWLALRTAARTLLVAVAVLMEMLRARELVVVSKSLKGDS